MTLKEFILCLPEPWLRLVRWSNPLIPIYSAKFFCGNEGMPNETVLYLCDAASLPDTFQASPYINLLVYNSVAEMPEWTMGGGINLIVLQESCHVAAVWNRIAEIFEAQQLIQQKKDTLYEALLSGKGLQHLVDTAVLVLKNPIFVLDAGYHFLASQIGEALNENEPILSQLQADRRTGGLEDEQILQLRSLKLVDTASNNGQSFYHAPFGANVMFSSVRIHGSIVAKILLVERHPFREEDGMLFSLMGNLVSQELQKDPFQVSGENRADSELLFHLLNTSKPSQEIIDKRLKLMNIRLKEKFQLAVLMPREGRLKSLQISSIYSSLQAVLTNHIHTAYQDALVFLIELDSDQSLKADTLQALKKEAQHNRLLIGISNEFQDLTELKVFFRQAEMAIQLGQRCSSVNGGEYLYRYQDCAYVDLVNTASQSVELKWFCHPYLSFLMKYDQENHTELLETLFVFLRSNQNAREASEALFIHKNTLAYRISKIKELLADDLNNSETVFMLNFSYRILIFLRLFIPSK